MGFTGTWPYLGAGAGLNSRTRQGKDFSGIRNSMCKGLEAKENTVV